MTHVNCELCMMHIRMYIVFIIAKLDNTLMNKLKSELDSEATTKEEVNYVCIN